MVLLRILRVVKTRSQGSLSGPAQGVEQFNIALRGMVPVLSCKL